MRLSRSLGCWDRAKDHAPDEGSLGKWSAWTIRSWVGMGTNSLRHRARAASKRQDWQQWSSEPGQTLLAGVVGCEDKEPWSEAPSWFPQPCAVLSARATWFFHLHLVNFQLSRSSSCPKLVAPLSGLPQFPLYYSLSLSQGFHLIYLHSPSLQHKVDAQEKI